MTEIDASDMPNRSATAPQSAALMLGGPRNGRLLFLEPDTETISVAVYVDKCDHDKLHEIGMSPETHIVEYKRTDEIRGNYVVFRTTTPYDEIQYVCAECVGISRARKMRELTWQYRIEKWFKEIGIRHYIGRRLHHLRYAFVREPWEIR